MIDITAEQMYYDYNRGFITKSIHGEIPDHAIPVSKEEHGYLLEQINIHGYHINVVDGVIELERNTFSEEEIAPTIRQKRDSILASTDWSQLGDVPDHVSEKYKNYRQKLRDVTKQEGFPFDVIWPTLE